MCSDFMFLDQALFCAFQKRNYKYIYHLNMVMFKVNMWRLSEIIVVYLL